MPLKAIAGGKTIIGPDLSHEDWADLKQRHKKGLPVTMACCGAPGHLRSSKRGIQHFYHAVDTGCRYDHESLEHLVIKEQIYRACRAQGWETTVEFAAPDRSWVADVYAMLDGRKVVFEIQISTISPDELEARDAKYRECGIESYWQLDDFLRRSKDFAAWYDAYLSKEIGRPLVKIPSIDQSLFRTGPENHIFIAKGIRSAGLHAEKKALFTTNNKEIRLAVWVQEVLKGNYRNYLEESADACNRRCRLAALSAPHLVRSREFYNNIIRSGACRKKAGHCERLLRAVKTQREAKVWKKKCGELHAEIDWLEKEYRSFMSDSSGLFTWKKIPGQAALHPIFLPESEAKVRKLREYVEMFERWEAAFEVAYEKLERGLLEDGGKGRSA